MVNYFVAVHSATVTACATSADCHLIVTLERPAVCPFSVSQAFHLLIVDEFDVKTLRVASVFLSIFKCSLRFLIDSASSFDLCVHSMLNQSHDC